MGLAKDKMGGDFSWLGAQCTEWPLQTTVSAAGTTQGTSTATSTSVVRVTVSASLAGVQAYNGMLNDSQWFINDGTGNTMIVYPPNGNQFNNLGTNTGVQVANNSSCIILKITSTRHWVLMSA